MVTLRLTANLVYDYQEPAETLLLIEAAQRTDQAVLHEHLSITPSGRIVRLDDPDGGERRVVFTGSGRVTIEYEASVDVERPQEHLATERQVEISKLPPDALRYLRPSRFCPSDRFERFVEREFGGLAGGARVVAILDWIADHVDYVAGVSDASTSALATFADRAGVCRDFAHLVITLCRASDIPARAMSAYAWKLHPPDLHAVAEVYVGGDLPPKKWTGLSRFAFGLGWADVAQC